MLATFLKKGLPVAAGVALLWLGVKYLLPVALPFLLGAAIAFLAEPAAGPIAQKANRTAASAVAVTLTLAVLSSVLMLIGAVAVRQVGRLAQNIPEMADTARQGMVLVQDWLVSISEQMPETVRPVLQRKVLEFFGDGTVVLDQVAQRIPAAVTTAIGTVGSGALSVGTGVVAAFLISARLPKLKAAAQEKLPASWKERYLPALRRVRKALVGWLQAQLKLCAITWGIVSVGFFVLQIRHAPLWAALVAVVDAVPVLGTGTVLVPWAAVSLLQGQHLHAIGLLCIYGTAAITRTVLEPRLVGRHLGLDPLVTLAALYAGYRFWGFPGLLLTPILASAVKSLVTAEKER